LFEPVGAEEVIHGAPRGPRATWEHQGIDGREGIAAGRTADVGGVADADAAAAGTTSFAAALRERMSQVAAATHELSDKGAPLRIGVPQVAGGSSSLDSSTGAAGGYGDSGLQRLFDGRHDLADVEARVAEPAGNSCGAVDGKEGWQSDVRRPRGAGTYMSAAAAQSMAAVLAHDASDSPNVLTMSSPADWTRVVGLSLPAAVAIAMSTHMDGEWAIGSGDGFPAAHTRSVADVDGIAYVLPEQFGVVEPGIFRCAFPMRDAYPFLRQLRLRTVINLLDRLPAEYVAFMKVRTAARGAGTAMGPKSPGAWQPQPARTAL
jgi:hypothetical protein